MDTKSISRRTVLRGFGAAIALPWLDAMEVRAAAAIDDQPVRLAFIYVPNGIHMPDWTPKETGSDFTLPSILSPLADVRQQISVYSGLAHDKARPNGDGPGDHARSAGAYLTASQPRKTNGADIHVGVSVDQVAAANIGERTRLPSLELGIDRGANSGNCDSGYSCAYSANISWRSPTTPNAKEVNPRAVFERLFGGGGSQEAIASRKKRNAYRKSILDFVQQQARSIQSKVSVKDRQKLDEYLTSVREIEQRIVAAEQAASAGPPDPTFKKPTGVPRENADHIRLMYDLMALAFQADVTRISTFMVANAGSNRSYRNIGVSEGHHSLSHHGNNKDKLAKISRINKFHVELLAGFLKRLASIREGNGSVLDNSLIMYGCAIGDGNRHNHDDLPVMLAGSGGGVLPVGQHIKMDKETPVANLFLSMLNHAGAKVDAFGDSTGPLSV